MADFRHFLLQNGLSATDEEVNGILIRYDPYSIGSISYAHFIEQLLSPI
jgi:Ca2+-binding EF-hand superfamily protein